MRPPKFPLNREESYRIVRGVTLFFHHGSWALKFRRGGKKWEESLGTRDGKLAYAELQKATQQITDGITPQELIGARHHTTATVAEAAKEFHAAYTACSLGTQRKLRGVLAQWVIGANYDTKTQTWIRRDDAALARDIGALEIHTVETRDVRAHLQRVRGTVNRLGRRNSRGFAKMVLDAIRLLFAWLIEEGRLKSRDGRVLANPAARCGRFTFDAELDTRLDADGVTIEHVKVFDPEQEDALLNWFRTYARRHYPMVLLGVGVGARIGEVLALNIDDWDRERHVLRITKHWTPDGVIVGTKSNRIARGKVRTRDVPTNLDPRVEPALAAHIARLRETKPRGWDGQRLFAASAYTYADGSTNVGAYMTPQNFRQAVWLRACADLGVKDLTFHNLRHTFASKALHAGATPAEVAAWIGDTLQVFLGHYAHPIKDAERERSRVGLLAPVTKPASGQPSLRVVKRG